jgi:cation diffusion facilitator CzcD-associated flavoprotein CzcO
LTHVHVAIVGAGFGGIGAAIRLKQQGIDDFVVLERASRLGGTWRDNTYPGCACDVPSHLYSFSFAPNPNWTNTFSPQGEIWEYLEACTDRFGVRDKIRFNADVRGASWDDATNQWTIDTTVGEFTADVLISGAGPLNEPSIPKLPGLETFTGPTFHSSRWDHGLDLTGRRVAVVGTGASAIQFVPQIQPKVAHLTVLQRTPPWITPRRSRPLTDFEHRAYQRMPALQTAMRGGIYWARELLATGFLNPKVMRVLQQGAQRHLERSIPDPAMRAKLTPDYRLGCKRILLSNDYYPALRQDNVDLVTAPIREIRPQGIVTADGVEHDVDTIIFGTGFHVTDTPIAEKIRGRDGRTLAEVWEGSPKAYRGITVSGFPNLFLLVGPNTGLGHTSIIFMIESQVAYILDALKTMRRRGLSRVEPRPEMLRGFVAVMDYRMRNTVWLAGGCNSWYLDPTGRNSTIWPGYTWKYRQETRRFDADAYVTA